MPPFDTKPLLDVLSVPLGDLIASVGRGVADAQREMDSASIDALREIYGSNEDFARELQRIGYRPTWYHIPEAEGELTIALTVTGQQTSGSDTAAIGAPVRPVGNKIRLYAAPVDAGYVSRFGFNIQATSRMKFRIVPVPPSSAAEGVQVVPALVGLTVSEARARLALLHVQGVFDKDAGDAMTISAQDPPPGTLLAANTSVAVKAQ